MSCIKDVPNLRGDNYTEWRKNVDLAFVCAEMESVVDTRKPFRPTKLVRDTNDDDAAWDKKRRDHAPLEMSRMASLLDVCTPSTTCSATTVRRQLLSAIAVATSPSPTAVVSTPRAAALAATTLSSALAATPPSAVGAITCSATAAEAQPLGFCVIGLARYMNFLYEEEEHQVEHAKRLTAIVATADTTTVEQNEEIHIESLRFEEARQGVRRVVATSEEFVSSSSSVGSSSSSFY